jgi:hypothetical protein
MAVSLRTTGLIDLSYSQNRCLLSLSEGDLDPITLHSDGPSARHPNKRLVNRKKKINFMLSTFYPLPLSSETFLECPYGLCSWLATNRQKLYIVRRQRQRPVKSDAAPRYIIFSVTPTTS